MIDFIMDFLKSSTFRCKLKCVAAAVLTKEKRSREFKKELLLCKCSAEASASTHCNHIPQTWSLRDRKQDIESGYARIHSQDDYSPVLGPRRLKHAHPPKK